MRLRNMLASTQLLSEEAAICSLVADETWAVTQCCCASAVSGSAFNRNRVLHRPEERLQLRHLVHNVVHSSQLRNDVIGHGSPWRSTKFTLGLLQSFDFWVSATVNRSIVVTVSHLDKSSNCQYTAPIRQVSLCCSSIYPVCAQLMHY
jgi:hypothetical protein